MYFKYIFNTSFLRVYGMWVKGDSVQIYQIKSNLTKIKVN